MGAKIIDGRKVAGKIRCQVGQDIETWMADGHRRPFLQVIQVGSDPASTAYISAKTRACGEVGIASATCRLPDTVSARQLVDTIEGFNQDEDIDGILLQLPLPGHIQSHDVIEHIDFRKDVDGFHPINLGRLSIDRPTFRSCTPAGILELLSHYSIPVKGQHAVVVGASHIVGSPMAVMFSRENSTGKATTTICHKFTRDLIRHTVMADILVVAAGQPGLVRGEMVKEGVVVIDVGINRVTDASRKKGYRLVGDCDYGSVAAKAGWMTPVPGGVGPMTVAMLMKNTLLAARRSIYPDSCAQARHGML
ncbi:MAG: bifunctional methylenetetrahydrofolate dehydrogenase/methenyltetrahydrofolate cyclohydrolase FolD [Pseudomonadota bacterium]|nr:MAG: bifunctional methylenetetrahydrofolate dehydrogenase/methenyltetrahydrofolate cyclohydrolase FolD [Pseudomonadota bacterium]